MKYLFFFLILLSPIAEACELKVVRTVVPLQWDNAGQVLCMETYFNNRDLLSTSINDDLPVLFKDEENMVFDDMLVFAAPTRGVLEEQGRLELIEEIFNFYTRSLKNQWGQCELTLKTNQQVLSLSDFKVLQRQEGGQPGTRRMLTKDDVVNPSWQVVCPTASGSKEVYKEGRYFFVFVDVYENKTLPNTRNHLAKFLFSFR